ncbi:hypothetical protein BD310DRAFT_940963, partial [Dichomitus squalens]
MSTSPRTHANGRGCPCSIYQLLRRGRFWPARFTSLQQRALPRSLPTITLRLRTRRGSRAYLLYVSADGTTLDQMDFWAFVRFASASLPTSDRQGWTVRRLWYPPHVRHVMDMH